MQHEMMSSVEAVLLPSHFVGSGHDHDHLPLPTAIPLGVHLASLMSKAISSVP
jgi:hypothetical protein